MPTVDYIDLTGPNDTEVPHHGAGPPAWANPVPGNVWAKATAMGNPQATLQPSHIPGVKAAARKTAAKTARPRRPTGASNRNRPIIYNLPAGMWRDPTQGGPYDAYHRRPYQRRRRAWYDRDRDVDDYGYARPPRRRPPYAPYSDPYGPYRSQVAPVPPATAVRLAAKAAIDAAAARAVPQTLPARKKPRRKAATKKSSKKRSRKTKTSQSSDIRQLKRDMAQLAERVRRRL